MGGGGGARKAEGAGGVVVLCGGVSPDCRLGGGEGAEGGERGGGSFLGPAMVPAEGGPNILKLKSSWHRSRRSKILAVSLKHWKGRGGPGRPPPPPSSYGVRPF